MIGRYIDELARRGEWEALDRIVTAQDWALGTLSSGDGRRCLVGHACDAQWRDGVGTVMVSHGERALLLARDLGLYLPINRFDDLGRRFGLPRVVRAIKLRAGKHTRPDLSEQPSVIVQSLTTGEPL